MKSCLSGFYKKPFKERQEIIKEVANISGDDLEAFNVDDELLDMISENVIGRFSLPFSVATNFRINARDYLVPMVTEESSVVAAASKGAKLARPKGFTAGADDPMMIGQIQVINPSESSVSKIEDSKKRLLEKANEKDSILVSLGGGAKDIICREIDDMFVMHLLVDVRDAMGANAVNTMCETIAEDVEELTNGEVRLRIVSNLSLYRKARAKAVWNKKDVDVDKFLDAYRLAKKDIFRAATHNKGIMNGIDAVALATGNDFRALEAGAHAFAAKDGYTSLTTYYKDQNDDLRGEIEIPIASGIVGGITSLHPTAGLGIKILDIKNATELAMVMASVGLAQNFSALKALSTEGIQKGHMKLHSRNIAVQSGAKGKEIAMVSKKMIQSGDISESKAKSILDDIR